MKIYVFSKKDHKISDFIMCSFLILIITVSISLSAIITGMGKGLYIEAVNFDETKMVIIDAGHGGEDPGAVGINGVYEKDLNLEIAFELGRQLGEAGYTVIYTRTVDKLLYKENENITGMRKIYDLKNRCKVASEYPMAIFVSVHMNSYGNGKYSGLQVYFKDKDNKSLSLADSIQNAVKEGVQPNNSRSIKNGKDIYILKNTENTAVLIECGFLTNKEECEKLSQKEYQKQLSFSIVCGIINYMDKN